MPVRLRLQRHGRKRKPFYHIVAADSRAPRDGRYIERIGFYNPNHHPAIVEIDRDKALGWLKNGAQPTNTVNSILSHTGVLYKKHLQRGVDKGAFSQEEADRRFEAWLGDRAKKKDLPISATDISAKEKVELVLTSTTEAKTAPAPEAEVAAEAPAEETNEGEAEA